ncbi:MAG: T9SS type A sorting domain-containing protein, partial [Bacteroidota bacterium]|nr:T9SS type A sorting domain-containing protein [Bacteroidota bacterium]
LNTTGVVDASFAATGGTNGGLMGVVELNNGQYLVAGSFAFFGGYSSSGVARLLADGSVDTSYSLLLEVIASGPLTPLNNGQLLLNSYPLTTFNGQGVGGVGGPRFHLINANGTYNSLVTVPPATASFSNGSGGFNFFPQADGTFYATYQNSDSTVVVRHILTNGTFDAAFAATEIEWSAHYLILAPRTITVHPGGGLLVSGSFNRVNGQPRRYLARLNTDGTLNTQFAPPTNALWQVPIVGVGNTAGFREGYGLANGQTLVLWNDATRSYLARLNVNGSLDNTFAIGTGGGATALFGTLPLASGKILVNGNFTAFGGQTAPYGLIRLLPTGAPDPTFTAASASYTSVEQPDGKLLILAPGANPQIERLLRLSVDGSLDMGFQPVLIANASYSPATAFLYLQPGTNAILLSGNFTSVAGQPRFGLARIENTLLATRAGAAALLAEVFPNPAHEQLSVRLPAAPTGPATVADVQGRTVRHWVLARATDNLPLHGLAPGFYLLSVPTAAGTVRQRFAVE